MTPSSQEMRSPVKSGRFSVHLTVDGDTVMGIGLPRIAAAPSKARIVPASTAMALAAQRGLSQPTPSVELSYDRSLDVLVWEVSQVSTKPGARPQITTCNVDAHTGRLISWTTGDLLVNMAPGAAQHAH